MGYFDFLRRKSFSHGIHPAEGKEATRSIPIRRLPFAKQMILPLSQHIGAPAVPIVQEGQEVVRGEPIAKADGFVSVPIHASATGVIKGVELIPTARGPKAEAIIIDVYEASTQQVLYGQAQDVESMTAEAIVQAVQDAGLAGLGGATFPSHVKLRPPEGYRIDTLLVNGCECEPYLTTDHRIMLEYTDELILGIRIAMKAAGAVRAVIGIEDNKLDAVEAIRKRITKKDPITVKTVRTKYPQGAEKILIKTVLGREVPSTGHSYDVGVCTNNVGTLTELGMLLPKGQGLIERVVTLTGPGVNNPGNYVVPLGTPLRFVLEQVGFDGAAREVILGGPMMGNAVASLDVPITKGVSGVLVLDEKMITKESGKTYPCIKCAKCVAACPMHLNPSQLGMLAAKRQYKLMEERYHLNDCFECGCCSYSCPSNIPLVQYFRIAKAMNREVREKAA